MWTHACACVHMVESNEKCLKIIKKLKSVFFIMISRGSRSKMTKFTWNCWGATSFWVSTSIWEPLLNAKKCIHVLAWALRESLVRTMKKYFLIIFNHVNACVSMRLLVEIHNSGEWCDQNVNRVSKNDNICFIWLKRG